jgi:hypothetical protein
MRRTQIYLTDEQCRALSRRASDTGLSQAEVIRRVIDRALGLADDTGHRVEAVNATAGLLADLPDWPECLSQVRGRGADERRRKLRL